MQDSADDLSVTPEGDGEESGPVESEAEGELSETEALDDDDDDDEDSDGDTRSNTSEPSGSIGFVLRAFDKVTGKYAYSLNQVFCQSETDLTIDQLTEDDELIDEIRTSLLPSLRTHLHAVLQTLDLSKYPIHPCPNQELTAASLAKLGGILKKTRSAVEEIALEPPLPSAGHDHHLERLKAFRSDRLLWKTKAIIQEHVCEILGICALYIIEWEHAGVDREGSKYQTRASNVRKEIAELTASCGHRIDELIEWSNLSDFGMLQVGWRESSNKLSIMIEALLGIKNGTYPRKRPGASETGVGDDRVIDEDHRARTIKLAGSMMPILKLGRLFFDTLSKTTIKKIPFTLSRGMCSKEIEALQEQTNSFLAQMELLLGHLCTIYRSDEDVETNINTLKHRVFPTLAGLQEALLGLSFHLKPSKSNGDRQGNFKTWFYPLDRQFTAACVYLHRTASSCLGESEGDSNGEGMDGESDED